MQSKLDQGFLTYAAKIANVGVFVIIKNFGDLLLYGKTLEDLERSYKDIDARKYQEYSINGIKMMLEEEHDFCRATKFGEFVFIAIDSQEPEEARIYIWLPQSRAGGKEPYLRSIKQLGRSNEVINENKVRYTAIQSRTLGKSSNEKNCPEFKNVTDGRI